MKKPERPLLTRLSDDCVLEEQLLRQIPDRIPTTLKQARLSLEGLVQRTLEESMPPPTARVEAMNLVAQFEQVVRRSVGVEYQEMMLGKQIDCEVESREDV